MLITKVMPYLNQNDMVDYKRQAVMEISKGDIIGEDTLIYRRKQTYSAKVLSINCQLYRVDAHVYARNFTRMIPVLSKLFNERF